MTTSLLLQPIESRIRIGDTALTERRLVFENDEDPPYFNEVTKLNEDDHVVWMNDDAYVVGERMRSMLPEQQKRSGLRFKLRVVDSGESTDRDLFVLGTSFVAAMEAINKLLILSDGSYADVFVFVIEPEQDLETSSSMGWWSCMF